MTRHHTTGAALGLALGLLIALMANSITAGAAAVATGEIEPGGRPLRAGLSPFGSSPQAVSPVPVSIPDAGEAL